MNTAANKAPLGRDTTKLSSDVAELQLPPAKRLTKLKRFLTTVYQFAFDTSPEMGVKVKGLIMDLVEGKLSPEQFHRCLLSSTKFPLRPFVVPFLKSTIPLMREELARSSKSIAEHLVFNPDVAAVQSPDNGFSSGKSAFSKPNRRSASPVPQTQQNKPMMGSPDARTHSHVPPHSRKRKDSADLNRDQEQPQPKASNWINNSEKEHEIAAGQTQTEANLQPSFLSKFRLDFDSILPAGGSQEAPNAQPSVDTDLLAKEWKNVDSLFSTLMGTMEQLRYSLVLFHHRLRFSQACKSETQSQDKQPIKIEEIKRDADKAVQEIKCQIAAEFQKSVTNANRKAAEMVATERAQTERILRDAQELLLVQEDKPENCRNCGRRANQSCSRCRLVRYCGPFCQHRDWHHHRLICPPDSLTVLPLHAVPFMQLSKITTTKVPISTKEFNESLNHTTDIANKEVIRDNSPTSRKHLQVSSDISPKPEGVASNLHSVLEVKRQRVPLSNSV